MAANIVIEQLSVAERLALLGEIWDSLDPKEVPLTDAQREELDRRLYDLDRNPDLGVPWEEAFRQIRNRHR